MKQSVAGIVYRKGSFLVGHRLGTGEMANRWEFPGGKVDAGETCEEALIREFREELGVEAETGSRIASVEFVNKKGPVTLTAIEVRIPDDSPFALTEHTEMRWVGPSELRKLDFVDSDALLFPFVFSWYRNKCIDE